MRANHESDDDLRSAEAKNERRALWGGVAVVLGLAAEVFLTGIYPHGESALERWGPIFADALVALGVFAEIYFARRARSKSEILKDRSDNKVAEANVRAAEARKEAEEAKLQYEKLKLIVSWRHIAADDREQLVRSLSTRPSTVQIEYVKGDAETQNLAAQLLEVFRGAAWKVELNARVFLGAAVGVWVLPNATPSESTARSVSAVSIAFSSIGLRFGSEGGPAADRPGDVWGPNSTPVRVIVGAKPEPMLP